MLNTLNESRDVIKPGCCIQVWRDRIPSLCWTPGGTILHQPRSLRRLQELQDLGRLPHWPQPAVRQGDADWHLGSALSFIRLRGWRRRRRSHGEWRLGERERPACSSEGVGGSAALPYTGRHLIVFRQMFVCLTHCVKPQSLLNHSYRSMCE